MDFQAQLPSLETLNLSFNRLTLQSLRKIHEFRNLRQIHFNDNLETGYFNQLASMCYDVEEIDFVRVEERKRMETRRKYLLEYHEASLHQFIVINQKEENRSLDEIMKNLVKPSEKVSMSAGFLNFDFKKKNQPRI